MSTETGLVEKGMLWTAKSALVLSLLYLVVLFFIPIILTVLDLRNSPWSMAISSITQMFEGLVIWLFLLLVVGGFFGVVPFLIIGGLTGVILGRVVLFTERRGLGSIAYVAVGFLLSIFSLIWILFHYLLQMLWLPAIVVPPILIYFVTCLFITRRLIAEARRMREAAA